MPKTLSSSMRAWLEVNRHLFFASMLDDGDALVLDTDGPPGGTMMAQYVAHYGPYVLTRDLKLQDVNDHYVNEHGFNVTCWYRKARKCKGKQ